MLLHGVGTSSGEWSWVLPDLARNNLVYAIDLPGYDGSYEPPDYSPAYTASFVNSFLDAVGVERAVVVGNSFGGLVALHLALSEPARVSALVLSDSAGLGRTVSPVLAAVTLPGAGELARALAKTRLGAYQRAVRRALLLFARPWQIPLKWVKDQYKLAQLPNFTDATLGFRAHCCRPDGTTRGVVRSIPSTTDADAYRVGDRGQGTSLLPGERRDRPRARWLLELISTACNSVATYLTSSNPSSSYRPSEGSLASNLSKRVSRHRYSPSCRHGVFSKTATSL